MNAPIRVRMTAWYVAVLALVLVAVGAFVIVQLRSDLTAATDRSLRPAARQIADGYRAEGVPEFRDSSATVLSGERAASQVLDASGRVVASFGDVVSRRPMRAPGAPAVRTVHLDGADFRVASQPVTRRGQRQTIVAAASLAPVDRSVRRVLVLLLIALPAALFATAGAGWWLARRALAPIDRMTSMAAAIGPDALGQRVQVPPSHDEVARLARTLNTMLDRIQSGVEDQQRLVADTSHELRTPLAAMRAEIDVSLREDELAPAARRVLESAREELDRISATVDDLLVLARADERGLAAVYEQLDLRGLAAGVVERSQTLADSRGVDLRIEGPPAPALGDPESLRHALRNLVDNALIFTPQGSAVVVRSARSNGVSEIAVCDQGPGVPPQLRERIFERFFRTDAARTRAAGGSGLGLAIVSEVARAHGGSVDVAPAEPRGSVFTFRVPSGLDSCD
jgi:two-component system OmpR family sensor kinase